MSLAAGSRIGAYEVVSLLGAGGMGEVYRARDTQLKREVAIKVLPEVFATDAERLARFQREAELLATLNHPNIAAVYGLEKSGATTALVLELVEGPTLADVIARGPMAIADALPIARQIADALEAAHEKGVIHRDLKPANIKLTSEGKVKVLDFGLAKLAAPPDAASGTAMSLSPTLSIQATYAGVILGTAAYMSPEQARGRTVDRRTDIWAFGCVLYEMLTGARPFDGEDIAEVIGAVIHKPIDWTRLPAETPGAVRVALQRCLEKEPRQRFRDIGDVQLALGGAFDPPVLSVHAAPALPASGWRRMLPAAAYVLAGAAVAVGAIWLSLGQARSALPPRPLRFVVVPPAGQPIGPTATERQVAISPNGSHIVYVSGLGGAAGQQLMVRALDRLEADLIRGITGARFPFISPDGQWVGFFQGGGSQTELRKVSITGGPPLTIAKATGLPRGGSWGADDTIVFATTDTATGLLSVPAGGGEPKVLTKPDVGAGEQDHVLPTILPGGRAVLFTVVAAGAAAQLENAQIVALELATGRRTVLIRGGTHAEYAESGHLVYATSGALRAVRFDPDRLQVSGDPAPVLDQLSSVASGAAQFAMSRTGMLVYIPGGLISAAGAGGARSLVWVDRRGVEEPIKAPIRSYFALRLSPDGTRVALDIRDQDNDIWIWDLVRRTLDRRTFEPTNDIFPIWTPDGRRIVFSSTRAGDINLFWQSADGTGAPERLTTASSTQMAQAFTADGSRLVVSDQNNSNDLVVLSTDAPSKTEPLIQTAFNEIAADLSRDGRWLAYQSNESGQFEVYVRPFPDVNAGRWQVSTAGGTKPVWAPNGRELFYLEGGDLAGRFLMTVPVQTSGTFTWGNPARLFEARNVGTMQSGRFYDVSPDGKRFIVIKDAPAQSGAAPAPTLNLVLVVNWLEELKQRLPAD